MKSSSRIFALAVCLSSWLVQGADRGVTVDSVTGVIRYPTNFVSANGLGVGGGGSATNAIVDLNGMTNTTQTFAIATTGTDFTISSAAGVHSFNLPTASAANRGALSAADWSLFNGKQAALVNSAGLATALSDETGTGLAVFATSPSLTTPAIGVATATSLTMGATNVTGAIAGKENLLVNSAGLAASLSDETGTGVAVFGTSPALTTPNIGAATGTSLVMGGTNVVGGLAGKENLLVNSAGLLAALSNETGTGLAVFSGSPTFTGSPILADPLATSLVVSNFTRLGITNISTGAASVTAGGPGMVIWTNNASTTVTLLGLSTSTSQRQMISFSALGNGAATNGFTCATHTIIWRTAQINTPANGVWVDYDFMQFGTLLFAYANDGTGVSLSQIGTADGGVAQYTGGAWTNRLIHFTPAVTPPQITADQNNYNPTSLDTVMRLHLTTDAARTITGLQTSGVDGRTIFIWNAGSFNITFPDSNASSSTTNRFTLPRSMSVTLVPGEGIVLLWSATTQRWRSVTKPSVFIGDAGAGGSAGLVPAPAAGDAAAGKFLKADGVWTVVSGSGTPGGSDTQLQYNNAGAFGGAGMTVGAVTNLNVAGNLASYSVTATNSGTIGNDASASSTLTFKNSGNDVVLTGSTDTLSLGSAVLLYFGADTLLSRNGNNNLQQGLDENVPSDQVLNAADGTGSNRNGGNYEFTGGRSTGTGTRGTPRIKFGTTGSSGSSVNPYVTALALGGTLKVDTTTTGNVGAGEDDLISYTIPAGQLGKDLDYLEFDVFGTFAANANTAQVKLFFDGVAFFDTTSLVFNGVSWRAHGKIVRTGAATQKITCEFTLGGTLLSALNGTVTAYATDNATLSGAVIFKVTGQDTGGVPADNKVVQQGMVIKQFLGQ